MKKILVLIFFLIMGRAEAAGWSPELRIGLLSGVEEISLQVSAPCIMIDAASKKTLKKIPAEKFFTVKAEDLKAEAVEVRPEKIQLKDLRTTIEGREYYGGVRINKVDGKLTVISLVPVEEYLRGVVPKEMPALYPLEALKAQTVAARSFAMKNRKRHEADGYDVCTTTHCQVYEGVADYDSVDWAVDETRGEVLAFKDTLINANFHQDSGGVTEGAQEVWGRAIPYLVSVKERFTSDSSWTVKASAQTLDIGTVKSVKVTVKTASGRVQTAQIVGANQTLTLTGRELRTKFSLPSTLFNMKLSGDEIIFTGFGSGHGVGMSQRGAKTYAEDAWSYEKILKHYYKGTNIKKLY